MRHIALQQCLIIACTVLVVVMVAFPPYMGEYLRFSDGLTFLNGTVSYHPIWSGPPTVDGDGINMIHLLDVTRLTVQVFGVVVLFGGLLLVLRMGTPNREP
jgi:hypothetical protein